MEESTMADPTLENATENEETIPAEIADNPGMRAAALRMDPSISLEEGRNATAGEGPNAAGGPDGSVIEDYIPSNSDPNPTNLASTDHPVPDDAEDTEEETQGTEAAEPGKYAH
jgi:hypothetical protein